MRALLTIGSLFSGIGGLELGLEHATGGRVCWQVERDAWCRDVLAKHWPDAVRHDDVCTVRGLPAVDLICGGFPCQDVSVAGKRAGFSGERSSLWREYRRIVADVRPRLVFVENVPGLLTADDGHAFAEVLGDLAALGFDAEWDVFRASDVGAPHRRERLFLLAYRDGAVLRDAEGAEPRRAVSALAGHPGEAGLADASRLGEREPADEGDALATRGGARVEPRGGGESLAHAEQCQGGQRHDADVLGRRSGDAEQTRVGGGDRAGVGLADPDGLRLQESWRVGGVGGERSGVDGRSDVRPGAERGAQSRVGLSADGLPRRLDAHQWPAGRGEAQHPGEPPRTAAGVANRAAQLKAYGNAVVPAQAALAWRALSERAGLRGAA